MVTTLHNTLRRRKYFSLIPQGPEETAGTGLPMISGSRLCNKDWRYPIAMPMRGPMKRGILDSWCFHGHGGKIPLLLESHSWKNARQGRSSALWDSGGYPFPDKKHEEGRKA